jgi:microsomal dipeptidase-like Zn-dependent dipeptidase
LKNLKIYSITLILLIMPYFSYGVSSSERVSIVADLIQEAKMDSTQNLFNKNEKLQILSMANKCYSLWHGKNIDNVVALGAHHRWENQYYLKPSAMGEYLLHHQSGKTLSLDNGGYWLNKEVDEKSVFVLIEHKGALKLMNKKTKLFLKTKKFWFQQYSGTTWSKDAASPIYISPQEECITTFPEAEIGANVEYALKTQFDNGDLYGIADPHNHMMAEDLAAGFANAGKTFSPFGIEDALGSCAENHGKDGKIGFLSIGNLLHQATSGNLKNSSKGDLNFSQLASMDNIIEKVESKIEVQPTNYVENKSLPSLPSFQEVLDVVLSIGALKHGHDDKGYPTFKNWPHHNDAGHSPNYYQWINRARLAGLRMMTVYSTNSNAACKVAKDMLGPRLLGVSLYPPSVTHQDLAARTCDGNELHNVQVEKMHKLEKYIDAQYGGKDKGWLEIVTSPNEAREVVKQGRLAIILGAEIDDLFNCVLGAENPTSCSFSHIEEGVEALYQQGVRVLYPAKHYDNEFAGTKQTGIDRELIQYVHNGKINDWEVCKGSTKSMPLFSANTIENGSAENYLVLKFLSLLGLDTSTLKHYQEELPDGYGYCNVKGLTDKGEFLVKELMKRGMMLDIDHLSTKAVKQVQTLTAKYDYPRLATHTDELTPFTNQYFENQGLVTPLTIKATKSIHCAHPVSSDFINHNKAFADASYKTKGIRAITFSTDFMGSVHALGPRFNEADNKCDNAYDINTKVKYPFSSYDGSVVFEKQVTGVREFDYNIDGFAHYGMLPDMIQDIQSQEGFSNQDIDPLFRGAESYIRTWEQAVKQSIIVRQD